MAANEKSAFIRDLKKREKELAETAKEEQGGGFLTDEDIISVMELSDTKKQFPTNLSRVRYGTDKNKNPYFSFNYVVNSGVHKGVSVSRFVGLGGRTKADRQKGMKQLVGSLQRLGIDTTKWPATKVVENAVEAADSLTKGKPEVILGLSTYDRQDKSKGLSVDIISLGTPSSNGAPPKARGKAKSTPSDAFTQMGIEADEAGEDSHAALEAAAERHELDPDEYETWEELGIALDEAEGSSDSDTDSDPDVDYASLVNPDEYGATFDSGEGEIEVSIIGYDEDSGLFTVADEDENEYECEFSDLTLSE